MLTIHPKTSGAAVGTALGVLIVAVLHSISGVHLAAEADAAIPSFLGILGSWLVPSPPTAASGGNPPPGEVAPAPVAPAPAPPPVQDGGGGHVAAG